MNTGLLLFGFGLLITLLASCKSSRRFKHPCHKQQTIYPVKVIGYTVRTNGSSKVYRSK